MWAWWRVAAAALSFGAAAPAGAKDIGWVTQKEYTGAEGFLTDGQREALEHGVKVYAFETVVTGVKSTTVLLFHDTSSLQVGNNARVVLDNFVYDPDPGNGRALIKLGKGAFRFVTGYSRPEDNLTIRTPTTSMVIRGTHLLIFVLADGTTEVNVIHGQLETQACRQKDAMMLSTGQAALVDRTCAVTMGVARPAPPLTEIPVMPPELAALDIEPAAGPLAPETQGAGTGGPDTGLRGGRSGLGDRSGVSAAVAGGGATAGGGTGPAPGDGSDGGSHGGSHGDHGGHHHGHGHGHHHGHHHHHGDHHHDGGGYMGGGD